VDTILNKFNENVAMSEKPSTSENNRGKTEANIAFLLPRFLTRIFDGSGRTAYLQEPEGNDERFDWRIARSRRRWRKIFNIKI
jgi:hypothetical protein